MLYVVLYHGIVMGCGVVGGSNPLRILIHQCRRASYFSNQYGQLGHGTIHDTAQTMKMNSPDKQGRAGSGSQRSGSQSTSNPYAAQYDTSAASGSAPASRTSSSNQYNRQGGGGGGGGREEDREASYSDPTRSLHPLLQPPQQQEKRVSRAPKPGYGMVAASFRPKVVPRFEDEGVEIKSVRRRVH